ncbi:MAG: outer membrane lipoprotein-sorting protein [Acidobacteria bacterium]|nr:outer membrane lipoprotein-sorting protein [Acidobacteriota bacterium]
MLRMFQIGLLLLSLCFCACQYAASNADSNANGASKSGAVNTPLPDADKLIQRLVTQDGCKDFVAEMRIISDSDAGKQSQVEVQLQRKFTDNGASTFMTVLAPNEDSDKALLAIEDREKPTEAYSYLAGLKKLAKLDSSRPLGFRGAKVTVQELLGMELGHYSHDAGERVTEEGKSLVKITFQAKPDYNLVFPKIVGYFNEKDEIPVRFEMYGENGDLAKKMTVEEAKAIQNHLTLTKVAIEDLSQQLKLKMEIRKIEYNRGLSDKIFTENYLKNFITEASDKRLSD